MLDEAAPKVAWKRLTDRHRLLTIFSKESSSSMLFVLLACLDGVTGSSGPLAPIGCSSTAIFAMLGAIQTGSGPTCRPSSTSTRAAGEGTQYIGFLMGGWSRFVQIAQPSLSVRQANALEQKLSHKTRSNGRSQTRHGQPTWTVMYSGNAHRLHLHRRECGRRLGRILNVLEARQRAD